jgi:hypothetical protein
MLTNNATDSVQVAVNHLLANGIVTAGIVVGGILLATDEKLGVEELSVATSSDLVNGRRVQVDEEGTGNVFATAGLGEEGFVGAAIEDILGVRIRATIRPETVLEKVPRTGRWVVSFAPSLTFVLD